MRFAGVGLLGMALLLTLACAADPTQPEPAGATTLTVVLVVEDEADRALLAGTEGLATGGEIIVVAGAGPGDVRVSRSPGPGAAVATVRYWGAFSSFWSELESVSLDELRAAAATGRLLLPDEHRAGLMAMLGPEASPARWLPLRDVAAAADEEGALALLPVDAAGPHLRSLAVDDIDAVRGTGEIGAYALAERLYLEPLSEAGATVAGRLAASIEVPPPDPIRVVFTGDIIPARCVYARHRAAGDYTRAFEATAEYLRVADIAVGSLDGSISDAGTPIACERTFNLMAPSRSVEGLAYAGIDVMTVATNHAKDCGEGFCDRAVLDTVANLRTASIQPVGGGATLTEARAPAVLTAKGVRFAFLGYDDIASAGFGASATRPGTVPLDTGTLAEDVAAASAVADVVIVLPHWGTEYVRDPTARQVAAAGVAAAAGASLVVGNHPHTVQAVEWRDGAFVAYALGNFVFDQDWSLETQQGMALEATFHRSKLVSVRLLPVHIHDMHQPRWAPPSEARQILQRVRAASRLLAD